MPPNMWMLYDLYSASGQDAVGSLRYNKFLEFINNGYFKTSSRYMQIANYDSPLFDFLGITHIAAIKWKNEKPDFEGVARNKLSSPKFQKVFDDGRSMVLKNTKAYPRIFAVDNYKLASTDSDFERLLKSENLRRTAILERAPKEPILKTETKIENINIEANSTSAEVTSSGFAMVVLSQSYFPGWKAYVDDVETYLYRADYNFTAMVVPSGSHKVEVKYEPTSFKLGLVGGGVSAFFLFICYLLLRKRVRRVL